MRAFIAIDLPEEIRQGLIVVQTLLRGRTTTARWIAAESAHLTVKFLGEISEERANEVHQAMSGLIWKPFQVSVKGLGYFPGSRSPRVLWAGAHAPTLESLSERVDTRMERLGFEKERRVYRPHITLARSNRGPLEQELVNAAVTYEDRDFGSFTVDRCALYKSDLKPSGPVYTKLKEYLLS